ncbi:MAG: hypothetical protein OXC56_01225 [Chloroflexi bacterium]|nr:hypothetical protein [Chloroflexota bacterium]
MSEPTRCAVCHEPGTPPDLAECADCGKWFHLVLDVRSPDPGCGAATFGGNCGFSFACNPCIEVAEAEAATGGRWRSAVR